MPSRKVRRRRAKLKRHEYEYVVETEEGEEVPLEQTAEREPGNGRAASAGPIDRRGRPLPKPTWQRSLRRTAIFAPFIAVFLYAMERDQLSAAGIVVNTLFILALFLPFSYFVDRLIYNALARRQQQQQRTR